MSCEPAQLMLRQELLRVIELEQYGTPQDWSGSRAPFVVWRCTPAAEAEPAAEEITRHFTSTLSNRRIEWDLRKQRRNWLLAPRRYFDLEESGAFRMYTEIFEHLEKTDPELGRLANQDIREIAARVVELLASMPNKPLQPIARENARSG
jgi:hypothetical protein